MAVCSVIIFYYILYFPLFEFRSVKHIKLDGVLFYVSDNRGAFGCRTLDFPSFANHGGHKLFGDNFER